MCESIATSIVYLSPRNVLNFLFNFHFFIIFCENQNEWWTVLILIFSNYLEYEFAETIQVKRYAAVTCLNTSMDLHLINKRCILFQWLLVLMLSCHLTMTWGIESFHNGERFLLMRNISFVTNSMRSYVPWAYRRDSLWWNVTPMDSGISTSPVWHRRHSRVCVISGAGNNSETLSSHSLLASQVPLKQSMSWVSGGRWLIMNDVCCFSVMNKVSKFAVNCYNNINLFYTCEEMKIIIIIIWMTMFMVLSSWLSHFETSPCSSEVRRPDIQISYSLSTNLFASILVRDMILSVPL